MAKSDARLRVIYSNGTESDLLLRSLQRALYKDEAGRRITDPSAGPLFADQSEEGDRGERHHLCAAQQVRSSDRRGSPRNSAQNRRNRR